MDSEACALKCHSRYQRCFKIKITVKVTRAGLVLRKNSPYASRSFWDLEIEQSPSSVGLQLCEGHFLCAVLWCRKGQVLSSSGDTHLDQSGKLPTSCWFSMSLEGWAGKEVGGGIPFMKIGDSSCLGTGITLKVSLSSFLCILLHSFIYPTMSHRVPILCLYAL